MVGTKILLAAVLVLTGTAARAGTPCGIAPNDWCTSAKDSACGRHLDANSCRADPACKGMPYAGESVIACHWDENGYADNCPTVGCLER